MRAHQISDLPTFTLFLGAFHLAPKQLDLVDSPLSLKGGEYKRGTCNAPAWQTEANCARGKRPAKARFKLATDSYKVGSAETSAYAQLTQRGTWDRPPGKLGLRLALFYHRRVRLGLLAFALLIVSGVVACGGDDDEARAPLALEERVVRASEVPGSVEDPVETRLTADSREDFTAWQGTYVRAAEIEPAKLDEAGFVSAIHDTRFVPERPGGPHSRDAPHVRLLLIQFESEDGARMGVELLHTNDLKPCPDQCAVRIEEFDVAGVPDATGVRRFATAERLKALGEEGDPFDSYTILFADGPFAYQLEGFGPVGGWTEQRVEEVASKLHHRIEGAPPAGT